MKKLKYNSPLLLFEGLDDEGETGGDGGEILVTVAPSQQENGDVQGSGS